MLNNKNYVLLSTGGMGTTIFYLLGSLLVLGTGIILVTKRRISVESNLIVYCSGFGICNNLCCHDC